MERCRFCGRHFGSERGLGIHIGKVHVHDRIKELEEEFVKTEEEREKKN